MHEPRRFVEHVDFVTSPGTRATRVVTNLALIDFDSDDHRMRVIGLQPGVSLQQVREATGFDLPAADSVPEIAPPSTEELIALRALDGRPKPVRA
jgi:glutaconate CoA-transferase subunit B